MPAKTPTKTNQVKKKSTARKPAPRKDADKIRALEEQLAQREAELAVINSIQSALASNLGFQGIIDTVGDKLNEIFKDGNVGIRLIDKERNIVSIPYVIENGKRLEPFEISLDGPSVMKHIVKRRKPVLINSKFQERFGRNDTIMFPGRDQRDLKSWLSVPFFKENEVIGGISLRSWERENAFTESDVRLLQTVANSMIVALENARLFDETQHLLKQTEQRATELQIINNIGQMMTEGLDLNNAIKRVGERLQDSLKLEHIAISIVDLDKELLISLYYYSNRDSFSADHFSFSKYKLSIRLSMRGLGRSWVVNTNAEKIWRKFAATTDEIDIPKSFILLPLLAGKDPIGGITIADYEKEKAFTDISIDMLETIASNMGTAIQNVRLFDETQRLLKETEQRATELQIINNIGQMLTEGLELDSTLERVGDRLREVLKIESIGIAANDTRTGLVISSYVYIKGRRIYPNYSAWGKNMFGMRFAARVGGKPLVVNTNVKKTWRKFIADVPEWTEIPKVFVIVPLLADRELVGSITIADYENENAFANLPFDLLETIASNMGTAIQNAYLFNETQRLLKETDQRATELQIINNIGQTLTEGGDLNIMIQHVGERIQEALRVSNLVVSLLDKKTGHVLAPYMVRNGKQVAITEENVDLNRYKLAVRASARAGGASWVVNTNTEKSWRKFWINPVDNEVPKSFVSMPFLAGREVIGGITIADYENENAFSDLSVNLLETIASNMGTAIQNVRLFEETKRLFADAEESRASAEQANKAKSTFLANMSHELRTPLNAIMGFTRIVKKKAEGALPEKQIENLEKVLISSVHLLGLINTVLDIAKIEAGRMDVIPSKFSLKALADQCATLATPLLKPNVNLEKQVDETLGLIFSDQDKIKQIVLNLLSNAAKFTHEGKILLSAQKVSEEFVGISVTDSGIGISEEALGRVFEEFQQADTSTTREYGGTGLGLAISRSLARLLGGDLTATSELGVGSTFTLTVPIKYGRKPASSSDANPESVQSTESHSQTYSSEQPQENVLSKTILIVEDTDFNIDVLTQLLENEYSLLIAKDGAQGVDMAQRKNPDLILMDISLPVMDGYEATRTIRKTMKSTPIIGLSAHAMSGDAEKAKEAGCNDYLTKPVDEVLLIQKLNQYLR